ncbi:HEPN domain-containing protein [Ferroacidibacillus organovorans]|uniref:Uncharacterized protein n=1 Tax=Ferroacidibacillus organovorans TaxID=1765683 RepID=A0A1V4EQ72_9BACL|nr:HEPN domain-containing protein [Ferroacidibacillus organovorans]OPG15066.1 hypothetical protein B2M26_13765 [Ferroacidibacillus organovorans]
MGAIHIPDSTVDRFFEMGQESMTSLDVFHRKVGWDEYRTLLDDLLQCEPRISAKGKNNVNLVKGLAARLALACDFDPLNLTTERMRKVLTEALVDEVCGRERWLVYVPIRSPLGPVTQTYLEGSGHMSLGFSSKADFDMRVTDQADLHLTDIFDGNVDNRAGAPEMKAYKGWRVRYVWEGKSDNGLQDTPSAAYNRFASITSVWSKQMFVPVAVLRYPLSISASSGPTFDKDFSVQPQEIGPFPEPHDTITGTRQHLNNLWDFVRWFLESCEKIPQEDRRSLDLAVDLHRSAHFSTSSSRFFVESETIAEALLGEERELSRTVAQRIAWVLGHDENQGFRKRVYEDERYVYDLRSKIVHGRRSESDLQSDEVQLQRKNLEQRNRELILRALEIQRNEPLRLWADRKLFS